MSIPVSAGTEIMFFDLEEIEALQNTTRSVCTATKHRANPVMEPGDQNHRYWIQKVGPCPVSDVRSVCLPG